MNAIIDIIIAIIMVVTVVVAKQKGFVKTMLGTLGFSLALSIAMAAHAPVADMLRDGTVGDKMEELVHSAVDNTVNEGNRDTLFKETDGNDSQVEHLFVLFGAEEEYEEIDNTYRGFYDMDVEEIRTYLKDFITMPGADLCCKVLAFLIIFVIARIIIKIAEIVLDKVVALPVLKQANKILGVIAGFVLGVFRVFLFCSVMQIILPIASGLGIDWLASVSPDNSVLYALFESANFFTYFAK